MCHHVLVVDDDLFGREMTAKLLRADGYRVTEAVNGEDALQRIDMDPPDLILMDLSLPILDGWSTAERLKTNETHRHIPIIALTAHAMRGDRERALEVGCDDYISKPLDYATLSEKLQLLLPSKTGSWDRVNAAG